MKRFLIIFGALVNLICVTYAQPVAPTSGSDYIECSSCRGNGKQKCFMCMGMGGSGNGMYYRACSLCRGVGVIQCKSCNGTGVIEYESEESTLKITRGDDYYSSGNQGRTNSSSKGKNNGGGYSVNGFHGGGYSGNSSRSSSSGSIRCSGCGGTGTCTACGGAGGRNEDVGYYTGKSHIKWISCGSCRGSKRCGVCHGKGTL